MSQFDSYTTAEYVEAMRKFLDLNTRTFLQDYGLLIPGQNMAENSKTGQGRPKKYVEERVKVIEQMVNEKAARCEAPDTPVSERYRIARDYMGFSDAHVARELGVSRELVRRWGAGMNQPSHLEALAQVLRVPVAWLEQGGEHTLPANSHLGVRVGDEKDLWREQLFGLIQSVVSELPENADETYAQAFIEWTVFNRFELARAARRAGGRWQLVSNTLMFAPWVPLPEYQISKRKWTDEVEAIIEEELARQPSVYGAYNAMKTRCEAMGLKEKEHFPTKIALYKRIDKEKERIEEFGVDLNDMIAQSVAHYSQKQ